MLAGSGTGVSGDPPGTSEPETVPKENVALVTVVLAVIPGMLRMNVAVWLRNGL